jgi:acetamidase/formamidase
MPGNRREISIPGLYRVAGVSTGSIHDVSPDAFNYVWDNSLKPVVEIDAGDEVVLHTRDASDGQINRHSTAQDVSNIDFSHVNPVSGPVFVNGARPGDVLAVEILRFEVGDWGWTAIIPGFGLLADEFPDPWLRISAIDPLDGVVRFSDRVTVPLRPFPGTIGVAPAQDGEHSIVPPSRWGGNIDTRHLTEGATLYLPVGVEGALLSAGDTHAAQGDGEVCGTAVESAMDIHIRVGVRRDLAIGAPQLHAPGGTLAQAPGYQICTGVGPDLMQAARDAVAAMIEHLGARYALEPQEAYAVASIAGDLRIHEIVDAPNWVVGIGLPDSVLSSVR